ncbi:amidase signature enzyme [Karstenula rhodostoma CBS 690.94]|uniref:Amidase signature enzyme n=1 Tax=Karstenula rhodostoma CBS 690.94 TaxID=1392251 RepID=A0A9P4UJ18_9PLEO|nr:amidase signature enzyme [Karstenula rhodostoma CBS 690.94]
MEHPTQSVDYEAPFNPRLDGYQIPGGSSSGSASAIASYEWLDFAIATDATGSVRIPALWNGCFGLRPSTGALSTEGVVSVYPGFDTPGLLGRIKNKPITSPRIVIPPDFFTNITGDQLQLIEQFVRDLEDSLGTTAHRKTIADTWKSSAPVDERNIDIYLGNATSYSYYHAAFHAFDDFREAYKIKYDCAPFVTESNRWIWQLGSEVSSEQRNDMKSRIETFRTWFLKHYMKPDEQGTIIVLPISDVKPNYRDAYPAQTNGRATPGLRTTYLSPYVGAPELALPIGHVSFESRISGNTESLPVAVGVMGLPGSDMALVKLVLESLRASKRPTVVSAGTARMWACEDETGSG